MRISRAAMWFAAAVVAMAPAVLAAPTSGNVDKLVNIDNGALVTAGNPDLTVHVDKGNLPRANINVNSPSVESAIVKTFETTVFPTVDTNGTNIFTRQNPLDPGYAIFGPKSENDNSCYGNMWSGGAMNKCMDINSQHWEPYHCIIQYHGAVCQYYNVEGCQYPGNKYDSRGKGHLVVHLPNTEWDYKSFRCAQNFEELEVQN